MRGLAIVLLFTPALAASAPARPQANPLEQALQQARQEQALAEAETGQLEKAAAQAHGEAERLSAEEAASAQAIEAAEARITAADAQFRLAAAFVADHQRQLAEEQRPVSSLLAGLAVMARRPPILVLADCGGTDDLVKVDALLDSTLPIIRRRTRALSAELARGKRLETAALAARAEMVRSRQQLAARRQQFALLERRATQQALAAGGRALSSGDVAIAAAETVDQLRSEQSSNRTDRALAELLESEPPAPPPPSGLGAPQPRAPFAYLLPVNAPVTEGLGAVNENGVRSRGIAFACRRGAPVRAPADGVVRFSGPFRDYDGIVLLDHGGGWMTLIVNVSSELKVGDRIRLGDPLGRALGPIEVELSQNGQRFSPALIAGSSQTLSKAVKGS